MKNLIYLFLFSIVLMSCGSGDPQPDQAAQKLEELSHRNWKIQSVTRSTIDYTHLYTNFNITISGTKDLLQYQTFNRPSTSPWMASGTAVFGDQISKQLILNPGTADELHVDYEANAKRLEIRFYFEGDGYNARVSQVEGPWIFVFVN